MYKRRGFSGRSRFSSFRGRRPRVSWSGKANQPRKWEVGNFFIVQQLASSENVYQTVATALARIPDQLADPSTSAGRLQQNMIRALDIGGIVFNWNVFQNGTPLPALSSHAIAFGVMYTDRLNSSGGLSALPDWRTNTTPTVSAAAIPTPDGTDLQFPSRIHWREQRVVAVGANDFNASQQIYSSGSRSLRLRLRLNDEQGLFFNFAMQQASDDPVTLTSIFSGSIYYRVRY